MARLYNQPRSWPLVLDPANPWLKQLRMLLVATPRTTKSLMQSMLLGANTGGGYGTSGVNKKITRYGVFQTHGGTGYRDDATLLPALGVPSDPYGVFEFCVFYCADTSCASILIQAGGVNSGSDDAHVTLNSGGTLTITANGNINTTTGAVVGAGLHCLVFGNDRANSRQELWLDGALIQTWSSGAQTGFPFDYLRNGQNSSGNISIGLVGTGLGRGATYGNFARSLNNNPWQLFKAPRRVWKTAAAGNPALTGNSLTSSAGTLSAGAMLGLTGAPAVSTPGAVGGNVTLGLSGNVSTSAPGTVPSNVTVGLTGNAITSAPGTVTANLVLTGAAANSAPGSVAGGVAAGLTGNATTSAAGNVAGGVAKGLAGSASASAPGNASGAVTASLSGAASASAPGAVGVPGTTPLSGNAITSAAGTMGVSTSSTTGLSGAQLTATPGNVTTGAPPSLSAHSGVTRAELIAYYTREWAKKELKAVEAAEPALTPLPLKRTPVARAAAPITVTPASAFAAHRTAELLERSRLATAATVAQGALIAQLTSYLGNAALQLDASTAAFTAQRLKEQDEADQDDLLLLSMVL